jgi:hypothetical protein
MLVVKAVSDEGWDACWEGLRWACWNVEGSTPRENNGRARRWLALERMDNYYGSERGENSSNEGIGVEAVDSTSKGSSDGLVKLMGRAGMASFTFSQLRPPPPVGLCRRGWEAKRLE